MDQALTRIETLLRRYGHTYAANLAGIAHAEFGRNPAHARRMINSDEWWDSQDAVAAIDLAIDGGFTAQARADARQLRGDLVTVFSTLLAHGEHNAPGERIVAQFQRWQHSRL